LPIFGYQDPSFFPRPDVLFSIRSSNVFFCKLNSGRSFLFDALPLRRRFRFNSLGRQTTQVFRFSPFGLIIPLVLAPERSPFPLPTDSSLFFFLKTPKSLRHFFLPRIFLLLPQNFSGSSSDDKLHFSDEHTFCILFFLRSRSARINCSSLSPNPLNCDRPSVCACFPLIFSCLRDWFFVCRLSFQNTPKTGSASWNELFIIFVPCPTCLSVRAKF